MIVRRATPEDVPALAALESELFGVDAWSRAAVREELEGPGRHAVVAATGEGVVGYAVSRRCQELVDLQRIAVHPAHRRQGVARRLLDAVMARAHEEDASRLLLEVSAVNTVALAFYADAGFVAIDRRRRYYRDGSDAVVMRRSLARAACTGRGQEDD